MADRPETFEECEVAFERLFDVARETVFGAWTEPARMAIWWGPKGFTNPVCEIDARAGGKIWIVMRAADGSEHPMSGEFVEVVAPERFSWIAWPQDDTGFRYAETHTAVAFEDAPGGKTRMTVNSRGVAFVPMGDEMMRGMNEGWAESLERLAGLLA